ncbi:MAG: MFS transporter [Promethearchaeota archaeon]
MSESLKMKFSDGITTTKMVFFTLQGIVGGFLFGMWGQIQFFAASVLLIPQITITLIYLVYSIVDGINDPIIGYLADKSKRFTSRFGKRFPWIMIGATCGPIFLVMCFLQISSDITVSIIWLLVMMAIYETFMTSFEINHNSLFPDLFREDFHRNRVIVIGAILGGIITILAGGLIPILINSIGYLITTITLVIIAYIILIPYSYGIREPKEMKEFRAKLDITERGSSPVKEVVRRVFKDKNWMGVIIAGFCWSVAGACFLYGLNFFVVDNLGLEIGATALPLMMVYFVGFALAPLWVWISTKIGNKNAFIIGMSLNITGYLLLVLVTNLWSVILVFAFCGIGFSATSGVIYGLLRAEGLDNAAVNSGKREEGSYTGILKIFTAFSYFFQTLIFAIISGITGYDPNLGTGNTNFAKFGLKFQMSIIPMIILIIGTIAFIILYRLSKEDAKANKVKLEEIGL